MRKAPVTLNLTVDNVEWLKRLIASINVEDPFGRPLSLSAAVDKLIADAREQDEKSGSDASGGDQ